MKVDYCCLDGSAFSFGFAAAHRNTLILEESENVLSNYVNSIRPSRVTKPQTADGSAFNEYLKETGCISEQGILDSPSLAPVAAAYALHMGFNVLLGAKVISCEKKNGEFHIQIFTNSGLQHIVCRGVIGCPRAETDTKMLNGIVSGTDFAALSPLKQYGASVNRSFEEEEFIVSLPFSLNCQLNEARTAFVNTFRACFGSSVQIDAFASDFEYASKYKSIIEEFEAGVRYDIL